MGRARKNLTLEQRIEIARRAHAGEAARDLSVEYGVTVRHISRLAKEHRGEGVEVRDPSEIVSFRAAQSELEAFDAEWRARGFSNRSQALKAVLRARCGVLDVTADRLDGFVEAWRQCRDLTDAGMALAKEVRRGRLGLTEADRALVSELVDLAQRMKRELGAMKDHAQVQRGAGMPEVVEMRNAERRAERSGSQSDRVSLPLGELEAQNPIQDLPPENRNALNG
ncbi:ribbon-helix-helix domain-containing protein [Aliiroseovarius sp. S2029]|uniref:ribbon-helix-helix domain-containing protein n=1 Tax=Aliiroseovarius sp. S2029 TaxID=2936988 RepID=UPI0020C0D141|nr:ribbon-helix-helix domain-containing protein [Aliiroseovarius sp. S2029]MCK8485284.1 ribbon-helix-helix domain-containing protein [Aliiroseovarius sp. S2029]